MVEEVVNRKPKATIYKRSARSLTNVITFYGLFLNTQQGNFIVIFTLWVIYRTTANI